MTNIDDGDESVHTITASPTGRTIGERAAPTTRTATSSPAPTSRAGGCSVLDEKPLAFGRVVLRGDGGRGPRRNQCFRLVAEASPAHARRPRRDRARRVRFPFAAPARLRRRGGRAGHVGDSRNRPCAFPPALPCWREKGGRYHDEPYENLPALEVVGREALPGAAHRRPDADPHALRRAVRRRPGRPARQRPGGRLRSRQRPARRPDELMACAARGRVVRTLPAGRRGGAVQRVRIPGGHPISRRGRRRREGGPLLRRVPAVAGGEDGRLRPAVQEPRPAGHERAGRRPG